VALAGIVSLLGSAVLTAVPALADERPLTLDHGHVDAFNLALENGQPVLNLKEDVTGSHVTHPPEEVNLVVKDAALTQFPGDASYAAYFPEELLGTSAYYLPLTQDPNLLWPGWDSLPLGSPWNDVDIHVTDIDGPGDVFLWSQGSFGGKQPLLTGGGYQLPGTIHQSALAHVHANWAFTQPGEYLVTAHAVVSATSTGASATTNEATYLFTVGTQAPPTAVTVEGLANPYLPGATVQLVARPDVPLKNATYRWEASFDGVTWAEVPGQSAEAYAAVVQDGQQLRSVVTARGATVVSEPVTTTELAAGSVTVQGLSNPYLPGAPVELTAVTDAQVPGATYRWETSSDGATWTTLQDGASASVELPAVDGQLVRVSHVSGERTVTSEPVVVELVDLPTTLTLSGLADSYAPGEDVVLEAKPDVLVDGGVFAWETSADGATWEVVAGAAGSVLTLPAVADQQVRATYTGYGQTVVSDPVTVTVAAPSPTSVSIAGLKTSYAADETVELTATLDMAAEGATYAWETSADGVTWRGVADRTGPSLAVPAVDGQRIRVTASGAAWSLTSTPVVVSVAPSAPEQPTTVSITGLESSYAPGDTVRLTATTDRPAEDARYAWQEWTELVGSSAWVDVPGRTGATYSGAATDGQRLRVVVTVGDATLTSEPVTVVVTRTPPGQCWALDLDHGHVDAFNVRLGGTDGVPTLTLKEDVTGQHVQHAPEDVNLVVKESARTTLPAVAGVPEQLHGATAYYLPLTQDPDLLWPGWDSLELAPGGWETVDIDVSAIEGPGQVYLWSSGGFGGATSLLDGGGYQLPGTIHQSALAHVHASWAFTEPGAYYLTVTATAHRAGGVSHTTNTGTYLFTVGDADLPDDYRDCTAPPAVDPQAPAEDELTEATRGDVTIDPSRVRAGEQATVSLGSDGGGATVAAFLHSDPLALTDGWTTADSDGRFLVTVPRSAEPGEHRVSVVDADNELVGWTELTVLPARDEDPSPTDPPTTDPPTTDPPTTDPDPSPSGSGGTGGGGSGTTGKEICLPVPATAATTGTTGTTPSATGSVVVGTEGHFDFGPVVQDGAFQIQVKDDRTAPPVWRDPDTVVFDLGTAALRKAADIPAELQFVAPAGKDIYMIQQIQEAGVPWLGWNTQHETIVNGPGSNGVTMRLDTVEGPGELAIFLNGNFGQLVGQRVVDTVGGPTSYTIPANTHQHGNWVFTEPGVYAVTFTMSADGQSDTATLRFAVGQADPAAAAAPGAATGTGATPAAASGTQGRTASGQPCTLPTTGVDGDPGALAVIGVLAVVTGLGLQLLARRRRASLGRGPAA